MGIDPGSRTAGFGVVKLVGKKIEFIDSGVMKFAHIDEFLYRLGEIYSACKNLIECYQPVEVAFESLIYVKSAPALSKLAQARGAMLAAFLSNKKISVAEYSPNLIKSAVVGHGHADKEAMAKGVRLFFKQQQLPKFQTHDESDAVAIALCHALHLSSPVPAMKEKSREQSSSLGSIVEQIRQRG